MNRVKQLTVLLMAMWMSLSAPLVARGETICNTRDPCTITLEERSHVGPALAVFHDRLYMAWTGTDEQLNLMSSADGQSFAGKVVLDELSQTAPTLAVFHDRLYLAWTGTDEQLNLMSSADGQSFAGKVVLDELSETAPVLAVFRNRLHLAWTGTDEHLNLMSSADGQHFEQKVVLDELSEVGPALAVYQSQLHLAWTGTDNNLNVMSSTDGHGFGHKVTLEAELSDHELAIADGHLAWTGTDEQINFLNLGNGKKDTLTEESIAGPAITAFHGQLYLAWAGTDSDNKLNIQDTLIWIEDTTDSDGDGLLDTWEINGFDANDDGIIDVNLPTMGADPKHKDLFLELDWMPGHEPRHADIQKMKEAFAAAPIAAGGTISPDGRPGINLWVDTGSLTETHGLQVGDNLGGGNAIASTPMCGFNGPFYALKAANFNQARRAIFRYALRAPATAGCDRGGQGEIGGNDFVDHNHDGGSTMHELGHNLGLRHGGFEDHNCKPNYVSVMSYYHQFGIRQNSGRTILDFSPPRLVGGRGIAPLSRLVENNLFEAIALDPTDSSNQFIFVNGKSQQVRSPLNHWVDWDGDSALTPNPEPRIVNIDTADATGWPAQCANGANDSTLRGYDDWSNISLSFWHFGDSADSALNPELNPEPTDAELNQLEKKLNTTDLAITISASRDQAVVGQSLVYTLQITNNGPNPTQAAHMLDILPPGVTYLGASVGCTQPSIQNVDCVLDNLRVNETRPLTITVFINASVGNRTVGPITITNTASITNQAGLDPQINNNSASASVTVINNRVFDGLQALYTFEENAGAIERDASGVGAPMNLVISDTTATRWTLGGLAISATTTLASSGPATKIIDAARATNELTIEAWVRPAPNPPAGLGRIVSLANDSLTRDFTLAQEREDGGRSLRYHARLRTTATTTSGDPSIETPEQPLTPELIHVVYTRDALGMARIYVDGVEQARRTTSGDLSAWDASYHLALANELSGDRPWLGEYQLVGLYSRALSPAEVAQNFGAGPSGESTPPAPVGIQSLYTFEEGSGDTVRDVSGSRSPADLRIGDIAATQWVTGGLVINTPTILTSTTTITRVVAAIQASNELTIEAWLRPTSTARGSILSLAQDQRHSDTTLYHRRSGSQQTDRYRVDLLTHSRGDDKRTALETPAQGALVFNHIVYTRDALGITRLFVNGVEQAHKTVAGNLSHWSSSHLVLANELSGKRPWLGEYQLVALYNRALSPAEIAQRFAVGPDIH